MPPKRLKTTSKPERRPPNPRVLQQPIKRASKICQNRQIRWNYASKTRSSKFCSCRRSKTSKRADMIVILISLKIRIYKINLIKIINNKLLMTKSFRHLKWMKNAKSSNRNMNSFSKWIWSRKRSKFLKKESRPGRRCRLIFSSVKKRESKLRKSNSWTQNRLWNWFPNSGRSWKMTKSKLRNTNICPCGTERSIQNSRSFGIGIGIEQTRWRIRFWTFAKMRRAPP